MSHTTQTTRDGQKNELADWAGWLVVLCVVWAPRPNDHCSLLHDIIFYEAKEEEGAKGGPKEEQEERARVGGFRWVAGFAAAPSPQATRRVQEVAVGCNNFFFRVFFFFFFSCDSDFVFRFR